MNQPQFHAKNFADMVGITKQRVSELVADGKLIGLKLGRDLIIDVRDPVNQKWLSSREKISKTLTSLLINDQTDTGNGSEDLYSRSVVEECIKEAWQKCLSYASEMALPVACEQLARAVLKAGTVKKGAAVIRKSIEADLKDIEDYVDHAVIYIIDGSEAAAAWNDEHFDSDGNARKKERTA